MYKKSIFYDSSCNFSSGFVTDSVCEKAIFDLTKDYVFVIEENNALDKNENVAYNKETKLNA